MIRHKEIFIPKGFQTLFYISRTILIKKNESKQTIEIIWSHLEI